MSAHKAGRETVNHWKVLRQSVACLTIFILLGSCFSCKTSDAAKAAAKDVGTVSSDLAAYYNELSRQITYTIELSDINEAIRGVPFPDRDRAALQDISKEIAKRATLAESLSNLAAAYGGLAGSTASIDASGAASQLGKELQTDLQNIRILPKTGAPQLPDAMSEAAKLTLQFIQTHELKQGARSIQKSIQGLDQLFRNEAPIYESLVRTNITTAMSLADHLVEHDQADLSSVILPALKPFGIAPRGEWSTESYKILAHKEIKELGDAQIVSDHQSTDAISKALEKSDAELTGVITGTKSIAGHDRE